MLHILDPEIAATIVIVIIVIVLIVTMCSICNHDFDINGKDFDGDEDADGDKGGACNR